MKSYSLLLSLVVVFSFASRAQMTQLTVGTAALPEVFYDTKFDPSGSSINVGHITNAASGTDIFLVKLNALHQVVWQKVIVNPGNDDAWNVVVCANGDYLVTGFLVQSGTMRGFVSRVNSSNGNIIWTYTSTATASPNGDRFYEAFETSSNNIAVVGVSNFASNQTNSFIVLLNSSGTVVWSRISSTAVSDEFMTVNQLPNGNLILGGFYNAGGFYRMAILEMNESTATIVAQNNYGVSATIPGVPLSINSIWPLSVHVRSGVVFFTCHVFQGFTSDAYPVEYIYDQTTKNLSGNICYHTGTTVTPGYVIYPISGQDFILAYSSASSGAVFVSRVTNNTIVYDRQVNGANVSLVGMDVSGTKLVIGGLTNGVDQNGYELTTSTSFPLSTSPCNITTANTLVLQASNLSAVAGTPINLNAANPASSTTLTGTNTSYTPTIICSCELIAITTAPVNSSVCSGANASFGIVAQNNSSYQWQESTNGGGSWTNITNAPPYSGANTANLTISGVTTGMNNYQYRCVLANLCDNVNSASATLTVTAPVTPAISITASANPVCQGTGVTFTASITNGGAAPVYQWTKNNLNVGTNNVTYTDNALVNGDVIRCILTSNANCVTGNPASSNAITMTVNPTVSPSVAITASANPICPGTTVTFTATSTNGGSAPSFQWKKNNVNVGTNSTVYTTNILANGDVITCVLTSNANCVTSNPANSNGIVMTVNVGNVPSIRYPVVFAGVNQPVQLTARNLGGNSYIWQPATGLNNAGISNPVYSYNQDVEYRITIGLPNGCVVVDTQLVKIQAIKDILVPKAFSPNANGVNDRLYPFLLGVSKLIYFRVYNRWGNLVFETNSANSALGWDGTYKGKRQPAETYTWIAEGIDVDGLIIKRGGNTLLIR
jgi:gliding motility-associated-like protein